MKITKEEIAGFMGSVIICSLILLLLYFIVLKSEIKAGEEGILVNFGTVDWAAGTFELRPQGENRTIPQENVSLPAENIPTPDRNPPVITQNQEQTVAIDAAKREEERIRKEREDAEKRRLAEERRIAAEEQRRRDDINQQISGAFGTGNSNQSNEGTAQSGTGNQGSSQGNAATGAYQGTSGYGSFNLAGRTLGTGSLPRPAYSVQEEGRIVIDITVDPKGNVIFSEIGKGTNIDNPVMRKSALEAARKAKFNEVSQANNQSGTITYNYKLN